MGYESEQSYAELFDPALAELAAREMAHDGGDFLLDRVVEFTPIYYSKFPGVGEEMFALGERKRKPGTLKASWKRHLVNKTATRGWPSYEVVVDTTDPIAPFVEWDTRPHEIRPRFAKRLRFRLWPSGEVVTASGVHHPGTTGQHMMLRATNVAEAAFPEICQPSLDKWSKRQVRAARKPVVGG